MWSEELRNHLATLMTLAMTRWARLEVSWYGPLYAVCTQLVSLVTQFEWGEWDQEWDLNGYGTGWLEGGIVLVLLYLFFSRYGAEIWRWIWPSPPEVIVHQLETLGALANYIQEHPSYFPGVQSTRKGLSEFTKLALLHRTDERYRGLLNRLKNLSPPELNRWTWFHDEEHQIEGWMRWRQKNIKIQDVQHLGQLEKENRVSEQLPVFSVTLQVPQSNPQQIHHYLKQVVSWRRKKVLQDLEGISIVPDPEGEATMHYKQLPPQGNLSDTELKQLHLDSFFHPDRERIWRWAETVARNPEFYYQRGQPAFCGIICDGPPGTGKSILAYKLALALRRFPLVLDFSTLTNKLKAYQLLETPTIHGIHAEARNLVISLDELDKTLDYLQEMQEIHQKINEFGLNSLHEISENGVTAPETTEPVRFRSSNRAPVNEHKQRIEHVLEVMEMTRHRLSIRDLLSILQGPIPNDQMIIVASTNDFERIRQLCPPLVRDGRLTRIKFDYPDQVVVDQMSEYFFGRPLGFEIPKLTGIPTSRLTQFCTDLQLQSDDLVWQHQQFQQQIQTWIESGEGEESGEVSEVADAKVVTKLEEVIPIDESE